MLTRQTPVIGDAPGKGPRRRGGLIMNASELIGVLEEYMERPRQPRIRNTWVAYPVPEPDPVELLEEPELKEGDPRSRTFSYQLRTHTWRVQVDSVVNKLTPEKFAGMLRATLFHCILQLNSTRGGEWAPVAFSARWDTKDTRVRVVRPDASADDYSRILARLPKEDPRPFDWDQMKQETFEKRDVLVIEWALAELRQADPIDPLQVARPGNVTGNQRMFVDTRRLRSMPRKDQIDRDKAKRIIRAHYLMEGEDDGISAQLHARIMKLLERLAYLDDSELAEMSDCRAEQVAQVRAEWDRLHPPEEEPVDADTNDSAPE